MVAPTPPPRGGMSLYANLLDSGADSAVAMKQEDADSGAPAKKAVDPALRFQPIRRPQLKQTKPKPAFSKAVPPQQSTLVSGAGTTAPNPSANAAAPQRSTLADWAPTEEDEYLYSNVEKRGRGGRGGRKKKKHDGGALAETDWDELYDPARPTNVEEYMRSDERIREVREWKAVLYAHRRQRRGSYDSEYGSDEEEEEDDKGGTGNQFAPPSSYSFAPLPMSPPKALDDATGDDVYARRLALSTGAPPPASPPPPPPPPPPADADEPLPPPPSDSAATISRAPVRYEKPPEPPRGDEMDLDDDDDEGADYNYVPPPLGGGSGGGPPAEEPIPNAPRSKLPGQSKFAERLMTKYGWTKGSGLGADESGITSALRVQVEKRRKRADAEGGGWAEPGGRGKILGGKTRKKTDGAAEEDGIGPMSQVIVLRGMLDGMADLQAEIEDGLGQEIGEECGEKYGRVERLYIDVQGEDDGRGVFIKFTDQVSALRAVNALQGRIFNGNPIVAKFYDLERFESGVYR